MATSLAMTKKDAGAFSLAHELMNQQLARIKVFLIKKKFLLQIFFSENLCHIEHVSAAVS